MDQLPHHCVPIERLREMGQEGLTIASANAIVCDRCAECLEELETENMVKGDAFYILLKIVFGGLPVTIPGMTQDQMKKKILETLRQLAARQRAMFRLRYGFGERFQCTPEEVGRFFRVSVRDVIRAEKDTISQLHDAIIPKAPVCGFKTV